MSGRDQDRMLSLGGNQHIEKTTHSDGPQREMEPSQTQAESVTASIPRFCRKVWDAAVQNLATRKRFCALPKDLCAGQRWQVDLVDREGVKGAAAVDGWRQQQQKEN